jgi:hypothetical protein
MDKFSESLTFIQRQQLRNKKRQSEFLGQRFQEIEKKFKKIMDIRWPPYTL